MAKPLSSREIAKNQQILDECKKLSANKKCFDCGAQFTQYIVFPAPADDGRVLPTWVCATCSGVHREAEFNHKIKPPSASGLRPEEVKAVQEGGNDVAAQYWRARWSPSEFPEPPANDAHKAREFIRSTYVKKLWVGHGSRSGGDQTASKPRSLSSASLAPPASAQDGRRPSSRSLIGAAPKPEKSLINWDEPEPAAAPTAAPAAAFAPSPNLNLFDADFAAPAPSTSSPFQSAPAVSPAPFNPFAASMPAPAPVPAAAAAPWNPFLGPAAAAPPPVAGLPDMYAHTPAAAPPSGEMYGRTAAARSPSFSGNPFAFPTPASPALQPTPSPQPVIPAFASFASPAPTNPFLSVPPAAPAATNPFSAPSNGPMMGTAAPSQANGFFDAFPTATPHQPSSPFPAAPTGVAAAAPVAAVDSSAFDLDFLAAKPTPPAPQPASHPPQSAAAAPRSPARSPSSGDSLNLASIDAALPKPRSTSFTRKSSMRREGSQRATTQPKADDGPGQCPICSTRFSPGATNAQINSHIDQCLSNGPPPKQSSDDPESLFQYDWYFGAISREEAEKILMQCTQDTFLIRRSTSQRDAYVMSTFTDRKLHVSHSLIEPRPGGGYSHQSSPRVYATIPELVSNSPETRGFRPASKAATSSSSRRLS